LKNFTKTSTCLALLSFYSGYRTGFCSV